MAALVCLYNACKMFAFLYLPTCQFEWCVHLSMCMSVCVCVCVTESVQCLFCPVVADWAVSVDFCLLLF